MKKQKRILTKPQPQGPDAIKKIQDSIAERSKEPEKIVQEYINKPQPDTQAPHPIQQPQLPYKKEIDQQFVDLATRYKKIQEKAENHREQ